MAAVARRLSRNRSGLTRQSMLTWEQELFLLTRQKHKLCVQLNYWARVLATASKQSCQALIITRKNSTLQSRLCVASWQRPTNSWEDRYLGFATKCLLPNLFQRPLILAPHLCNVCAQGSFAANSVPSTTRPGTDEAVLVASDSSGHRSGVRGLSLVPSLSPQELKSQVGELVFVGSGATGIVYRGTISSTTPIPAGPDAGYGTEGFMAILVPVVSL